MFSILLINTHYALANGAPTMQGPYDNGIIHPINDDNIEIIMENIYYKNLKDDNWDKAMDVSVEYYMKNTSDKDIAINMVFVYDNPNTSLEYGEIDATGIKITHDDKSVIYEKKYLIHYFEEFDVNKYISKDGGWREPTVITFHLEFRANSTSIVKLSYPQCSGFEGKFNKTYTFLYYLQPAKFWKDFKDLNIYIELPDNYALESDMGFALQSKELTKKVYYKHYPNLPDTDMIFTTYRTSIGFIEMIKIVPAGLIIFMLFVNRKRIINFIKAQKGFVFKRKE